MIVEKVLWVVYVAGWIFMMAVIFRLEKKVKETENMLLEAEKKASFYRRVLIRKNREKVAEKEGLKSESERPINPDFL